MGATAVTDQNDQLLGIITDGDLRRMLQKTLDIQNLQAKDIMTRNPKTISKDEYAIRALNMMRNHNITQFKKFIMDSNTQLY